MIDLHTHTTASDGRCTPEELVDRAARAHVSVLAVTDHDTTDGCRDVAAACAQQAIQFVTGAEITAVADERDIHVLGYGFELDAPTLLAFLSDQRRMRIERVREMVAKLAANGIELDGDAILKPAEHASGKAIGRPAIARALVDGGHVASVKDAFDRWLTRGRPGFVPRVGPGPKDVFRQIHDAGGLASLAHPVLMKRDEWIPGFVRDGLDALEVYHPDHTDMDSARYLAAANELDVLVTGGSDFHGDEAHRTARLGAVSLPRRHFERLMERLQTR